MDETEYIRESGTMQEILQADDLDKRILTALMADGRRSYADVAAEVGMSTAAVHERVRKMLERGAIERFTIRVAPEAQGLHLTAFVAIRNDGGAYCRDIAARLRELPEVVELHSVAGEHDALAKVRCANARALEDVLYAIKAVPGVMRTTSTVVLNTEFER